jgi:hypothetical protein
MKLTVYMPCYDGILLSQLTPDGSAFFCLLRIFKKVARKFKCTKSVFTRVCTYVQRGSKNCFVVVVLVVLGTLVRILHFRPISPCFQLLSILCHCMHITLPDSLTRQPCPAALPGSPARQPCPAALAGSLGRQSCPAAPCPAALPRQPCPGSLAPAALPGSLARQPSLAVLPG